MKKQQHFDTERSKRQRKARSLFSQGENNRFGDQAALVRLLAEVAVNRYIERIKAHKNLS